MSRSILTIFVYCLGLIGSVSNLCQNGLTLRLKKLGQFGLGWSGSFGHTGFKENLVSQPHTKMSGFIL